MDEDEEFGGPIGVDEGLGPSRPDPLASTRVEMELPGERPEGEAPVEMLGEARPSTEGATRFDFEPRALAAGTLAENPNEPLETSSADLPGPAPASRTIVQANPSPQYSPQTTRAQPLPSSDEDGFDEPTGTFGEVARSEVPTEPPPPLQQAPKITPNGEAAERNLKIPLLLVAGAALVLLLSVAGGLGVWLLRDDTQAVTGGPVVVTPTRAPTPDAEDALRPLAVAPPLRDAANLAIRGRFDEAARAYAAIAREHPDRPELATMARVLHAKAGRR